MGLKASGIVAGGGCLQLLLHGVVTADPPGRGRGGREGGGGRRGSLTRPPHTMPAGARGEAPMPAITDASFLEIRDRQGHRFRTAAGRAAASSLAARGACSGVRGPARGLRDRGCRDVLGPSLQRLEFSRPRPISSRGATAQASAARSARCSSIGRRMRVRGHGRRGGTLGVQTVGWARHRRTENGGLTSEPVFVSSRADGRFR